METTKTTRKSVFNPLLSKDCRLSVVEIWDISNPAKPRFIGYQFFVGGYQVKKAEKL